jgi:hypothetical protein
MPTAMNRNTRITAVTAIAAVVLVVLAWLGYDLFRKGGQTIECDGETRRLIDVRDFTTHYWAYATEFEASVGEHGRLAAKLEPRQLQELSEAMQQGREFRQFVVAGYNSCAIGRSQYAEYGARFQALDGLARQIDAAAKAQDKARLDQLVHQFTTITQSLAEAGP